MADMRQVGESEGSPAGSRLRALLARPAGPSGSWGVPDSFAREHDIIVLVGEAGGSSAEVVDSVVCAAVSRGLVASARRCGEAGFAECVARCCVAGGRGCFVIDGDLGTGDEGLFVDATGCVVVSTAPGDAEALADLLDDVDVPYTALGQVGGSRIVMCGEGSGETHVDLGLDEL